MDFKIALLRKEAKVWRKVSPRVCFRLIALIELMKRKKQTGRLRLREVDYEVAGLKLGVSGRTLRRWAAAYASGGVAALLPKPIRGRPPKAIRGRLAKLILNYRKRYGWGAEVLQAHLLHDHGIALSRHKIERFLRARRLLRKVRRKRKNKHTRKVKIEHPGAFTQIDVKYLTRVLKNGKRCYVYSFIDHASKWRFKRAFEMFGILQTHQFVEELALRLPFPIQCLQSDNGAEFTHRLTSHPDEPKKHLLDLWCEGQGVRHKLIPPGEKELQGLVERSHRQDDEELYHRLERQVETIAGLNRLLDEQCRWWNARRRRKPLGWRSSEQWLADYRAAQEKAARADNSKQEALDPAA